MKLFHISDVLTVTTGRLVSSRHMDGIYDILNFLTGDSLFTHQLPRAMNECNPWLRTQFPRLFPEDPEMAELLDALSESLKGLTKSELGAACNTWVDHVRIKLQLPEMLPVYELGADMHTHINPMEEAEAMVGKDRVIKIEIDKAEES